MHSTLHRFVALLLLSVSMLACRTPVVSRVIIGDPDHPDAVLASNGSESVVWGKVKAQAVVELPNGIPILGPVVTEKNTGLVVSREMDYRQTFHGPGMVWPAWVVGFGLVSPKLLQAMGVTVEGSP
jgi:hypothetical protein